MLERAHNEAAQGRAVNIVTYDSEQSMKLRKLYLKMFGGIAAGNELVHCQKGRRGFVRFVLDAGFDYTSLTFPTTSITTGRELVLVDHAAIEKRLAAAVEMQHMFDPPPSRAELAKDTT